MAIHLGQLFLRPLTLTCLAVWSILYLTAPFCQTTYADYPLFVSQPNEILKLDDRNGDGDFLDTLEITQYAACPNDDLGAIDAKSGRIFIAETETASILLAEDHNEDGDALDYGEITIFTQLPGGSSQPLPSALKCISGKAIFVTDKNNGLLYRIEDINGDGDAFDVGETTLAAQGLAIPAAISLRPDGSLLLVEPLAANPIRILEDHNADNDFFDFAENIPYAETALPGHDLIALSLDTAYLSQPDEDAILKLHDRTGDNDCLDIGEVGLYATDVIAPTFLATDDSGGLYVSSHDASFSLFHILDINGDGDALDAGEVSLVAVGLDNPRGITRLFPTATCIKGDINGDQEVRTDDMPGFVAQLLGHLPSTCPADINEDGFVDGRDIQPFVMLMW